MTNKKYIETTEILIPSYVRYRKLFFQKEKISILRNLQYEIFKRKELKGKVLDFGGGDKADYLRIISCNSYESINIDSKMSPTWVTNIGENFPCPHNYYDTVISMNTIEHIYNAHFAIEEIYKALKKDGVFFCAIPFLYPIHAHPHDYFRPTASWWEQTLANIGFKEAKITPLLWGPFSTGLVCSGIPGPLSKLRIHFVLILDIAYSFFGRLLKKKYSENMSNFALGYFIEARKR